MLRKIIKEGLKQIAILRDSETLVQHCHLFIEALEREMKKMLKVEKVQEGSCGASNLPALPMQTDIFRDLQGKKKHLQKGIIYYVKHSSTHNLLSALQTQITLQTIWWKNYSTE